MAADIISVETFYCTARDPANFPHTDKATTLQAPSFSASMYHPHDTRPLGDRIRNSPRDFTVSTPIGYTKGPIFSPASGELLSTNNDDWIKTGKTPINLTIDKLPFEIRYNIANELSQLDCLSLMKTNRAMYNSTLPRLYQNIIVDEDFTQFSKEYDFKVYNYEKLISGYEMLSSSYINSSYTFKKLLQSYIEQYDKRPEGLPPIKIFQVVKLPDSITVINHELYELIKRFFAKLHDVQQLIWINDNFRLEFLQQIPSLEKITSLNLNIANDELTDFGRRLPNLVNFTIKPFTDSSKLTRIVNKLLIHDEENLARLKHELNLLHLSRFEKEFNYTNPSASDLILDDDSELEVDIVGQLFNDCKLSYLQNLRELSIECCSVVASDGDRLIQAVNLGNLRYLKLKKICEYRHSYDISDEITTNSGFLTKISPHLTKLKHLCLDYRENKQVTVPFFLDNLGANLQSLDLSIRLNESHGRVEEIYEQYAQAMVSNGKYKSFHTISVEISEQVGLIDLPISIPNSSSFYESLGQCDNLTNLRFSPVIDENNLRLIELIQALPSLSKLEFCGTKAGGPPHLGLGTNYPTIYDEWFKVQHVAIIFFNNSWSLRYIRINKCIFERNHDDINPRDGIDRWFEHHVRV